MDSLFSTYFKLGYQHILDINGYDHIVFVIALCAIFTLADWRKVAILVTAFTVGHSLTLALAVYDVLRFSSDFIETLIPITILITCLMNVFFAKKAFYTKINFHYWLALFFGFIHGMGFSNFLRAAMLPNEKSIVGKLFAFNLGLELGQLIIVGFILLLGYLMTKVVKLPQREWTVFVSGIAFGIATILLLG